MSSINNYSTKRINKEVQPVAGAISNENKLSKSNDQFADNRPLSVAQRILQDVVMKPYQKEHLGNSLTAPKQSNSEIPIQRMKIRTGRFWENRSWGELDVHLMKKIDDMLNKNLVSIVDKLRGGNKFMIEHIKNSDIYPAGMEEIDYGKITDVFFDNYDIGDIITRMHRKRFDIHYDYIQQILGSEEEDVYTESKKNVLTGIQPGIFTSHKNKKGQLAAPSKESAVNLRNNTLEFNGMAQNISTAMDQYDPKKSMLITLYRGMHSDDLAAKEKGESILEPIPFSTTMNKSMAEDWTGDGSVGAKVLIEMKVPMNYLMVALSYPQDSDAVDKNLLNQGQKEVTVVPSKLTINTKKFDDAKNLTTFTVKAQPMLEESVEHLNNLVNSFKDDDDDSVDQQSVMDDPRFAFNPKDSQWNDE